MTVINAQAAIGDKAPIRAAPRRSVVFPLGLLYLFVGWPRSSVG